MLPGQRAQVWAELRGSVSRSHGLGQARQLHTFTGARPEKSLWALSSGLWAQGTQTPSLGAGLSLTPGARPCGPGEEGARSKNTPRPKCHVHDKEREQFLTQIQRKLFSKLLWTKKAWLQLHKEELSNFDSVSFVFTTGQLRASHDPTEKCIEM